MIPNITQFIDQVVYERDIPRRDVIRAIEEGFGEVAPEIFENRYKRIKVNLNHKTGELKYYVLKEVVAKVQDEDNEIGKKAAAPLLKQKEEDALEEAKVREKEELDDYEEYDDDEYEGEEFEEEEEETAEVEAVEDAPLVPENLVAVLIEDVPTVLSRSVIQKAKQIIMDCVLDTSRNAHYDYYRNKVGNVLTGTFSYETRSGDYIINVGKLDGILLKSNKAVDEKFEKNERVKVYLQAVKLEDKRIRIELSRLHERLIAALFANEVPEIHDGLVVVKSAVRDRIGRVKVLVESTDRDVDPVGACVGVRGSRVKGVIAELKEERVDIIPVMDDIRTMALKALGSDEVEKVEIDIDTKSIKVTVTKDKLPKFIGKKGQNVRLASRLIKWNIDVIETADLAKTIFGDGKPKKEKVEEAPETPEVEEIPEAPEVNEASSEAAEEKNED